METSIKKENVLYLDVLKIIACFLVIVNHSGGYIFETSSQSNPVNVVIYSFIFLFSKSAVPLFIMISGALLLGNPKNNIHKCLVRVYRIMIPLLSLSLLIFIKNNGFSSLLSFQFIIDFIKQPAILPFWYLYMLIGLYLATPFLYKMIQHFDNKDYMIFGFLFLILPGIWFVIKQYIGIQSSHYFESGIIPQTIAYYVVGYYLSRVDFSPKVRVSALILLFATLIAATALMSYDSYLAGKIVRKLDSVYSITTIIPAISLFILLRSSIGKNEISDRTRLHHSIQLVASCTFGIYLIHYHVIPRLFNLTIIRPLFTFHSIIGIILLQIATFIVCFIIIYLIKKVPIIKRFI